MPPAPPPAPAAPPSGVYFKSGQKTQREIAKKRKAEEGGTWKTSLNKFVFPLPRRVAAAAAPPTVAVVVVVVGHESESEFESAAK